MVLNKTHILLIPMLFSTIITWAQNEENSTINQLDIVDLIIPKIEVLIEDAINYNSMIKFRKKEIEAKSIDHKRWKKYWTRNFGFRGEGVYGTFNKFSANDSNITEPVNSITLINEFNYNFGAYFRVPIEDILTQKKRVQRATIEIKQAEDFLEYEKQVIKEAIIRNYNQLLLNKNALKIAINNLNDAEIQSKMIDIEYKNGILDLNEYSRLKNIIATIKIEYEKWKSRFLTSKMLVENMIGYKIK